MREIKFRAWDKKLKRIREVLRIDFVYKEAGLSHRGINGHTYNNIRNFKDFELMQYTGFKDIDNIEIYEGDLLKDECGNIFEVIWDDRPAGIGFVMLLRFIKSKHLKNKRYLDFQNWIMTYNCLEIIGNVYENPELL